MGLLREANLAWMSSDDKLFLWSTRAGANGSSFCSFVTPSGQSIVSVGIAPPKKGVFKSNVQWCLIVTTLDEILLCALARTTETDASGAASFDHGPDRALQLVPTSFTMPTDMVRMLSVVGTPTGRIFLGGEDGCVYEVTYEIGPLSDPQQLPLHDRLELFYDGDLDLPSVVEDHHETAGTSFLARGKRLWFSDDRNHQTTARPRKCRKLNRSSNVSAVANALLPDFLLQGTSALLGGKNATGGGKIVQMVVDAERQCLYTLASNGWIGAFDLAKNDALPLTAAADVAKTARLYLEAVSRGQMLPPSSHQRSVAKISFPGGGSAAQAGVGGMEGARTILKLAEADAPRRARQDTTGGILLPRSIHVITRRESSRLTLVAVTEGGLRLYLSSLSSQVLASGPVDGFGPIRPLAPSTRLTLCHVRAPPPADMKASQDNGAVNLNINGSVAPKIARDKIPRVDASFYSQGVFVVAMEPPLSSNELAGRQVGDQILATCPDAIARLPETNDTNGIRELQALSTVSLSSQSSQQLVAPGGICETFSVPTTSSYGETARNVDAMLPGGLVWDIAPITDETSDLLLMLSRSQTPSDSELDLGIPPTFFPPSKIRADVSTSKEIQQATKGTMVHSNSVASVALTVATTAVWNLMLSRPLRYGITYDTSSPLPSLGKSQGPEYRLSKRNASQGFSATASERSGRYNISPSATSSATSIPRSARLRSWLLQPPVAPLNQFATQHLESGREFVVLNVGGLHFFGFKSLMSSLVSVLMAAGENIVHDSSITSFFSSYGYKEGCAMCLAIAIGSGPTPQETGVSEQLRRRACEAALARAFVPKLVPHADPNLNTSSSIGSMPVSKDALVPPGYDFKPSALSEGLTLLFARLVRPMWHKPGVVITEGRSVKSTWSMGKGTRWTPAKVEVLFDPDGLERIKTPLRNLLVLVRNVFSRAIKTVPGKQQNQDSSMDIDDSEGHHQYLTQALEYQSHLRSGNTLVSAQLSPREAEHLAHLIEEKNIHSLYRLLARTIQLLNLIALLHRVQEMTELREIDWGLLHGLTIAQLVETSEGQDRLENLLNSLVTASVSSKSAFVVPSAQTDRIANLFAEQCYLFFSPGSRFAYMGLRLAAEALSSSQLLSSRRLALTQQAASNFRSAAGHWYSAPLITGRILHQRRQESHSEIANRALQYGSPLAKAAQSLMQLEDVASIVEICLLTAANFKSEVPSTSSSSVLTSSTTGSASSLSWEQHLYHKRRESDQAASAQATSSTSSTFAHGTSVTAKDAIDTCYALVFHHMTVLLNTQPELADRMVSASAAASDRQFLAAFFRQLVDSNHVNTLLRLDSPDLEKWLRERDDPDLLWRYFNVQLKHIEAGQISWDHASNNNLQLSLTERIESLSRALNSFKAALSDGQRPTHSSLSSEDIAQKVKEVSETLDLARIQSRVLRAVDSSKPNFPPEVTSEKYSQLCYTLTPVSDLYNDFTSAIPLWDLCLHILHACRHTEMSTIQKAWTFLICEDVLPCATRDEVAYRFLNSFAADVDLGDGVQLLRGEESMDDGILLFENGDWANLLRQRIVELGRELYGTGADYVFPLDFLMLALEGTFMWLC
jgi:nuclear pore complex protein Nup155